MNEGGHRSASCLRWQAMMEMNLPQTSVEWTSSLQRTLVAGQRQRSTLGQAGQREERG